MLFLPELTILGAGLIFFLLSLGKYGGTTVRTAAVIVASLVLLACLVCLRQKGNFFMAPTGLICSHRSSRL